MSTSEISIGYSERSIPVPQEGVTYQQDAPANVVYSVELDDADE